MNDEKINLYNRLMATGKFTDRWSNDEQSFSFAINLTGTPYIMLYDSSIPFHLSSRINWYKYIVQDSIPLVYVWPHIPDDVKSVLLFHLDLMK